MSKPDDIIAEAWEAARAVAETVLRNLPDDYGDVTYEIATIARALMEAEERGRTAERERCVGIADAYVQQNNTGSGFDSQPAYSTAWNIAAAIRQSTPAGTQAPQDREG